MWMLPWNLWMNLYSPAARESQPECDGTKGKLPKNITGITNKNIFKKHLKQQYITTMTRQDTSARANLTLFFFSSYPSMFLWLLLLSTSWNDYLLHYGNSSFSFLSSYCIVLCCPNRTVSYCPRPVPSVSFLPILYCTYIMCVGSLSHKPVQGFFWCSKPYIILLSILYDLGC